MTAICSAKPSLFGRRCQVEGQWHRGQHDNGRKQWDRTGEDLQAYHSYWEHTEQMLRERFPDPTPLQREVMQDLFNEGAETK